MCVYIYTHNIHTQGHTSFSYMIPVDSPIPSSPVHSILPRILSKDQCFKTAGKPSHGLAMGCLGRGRNGQGHWATQDGPNKDRAIIAIYSIQKYDNTSSI